MSDEMKRKHMSTDEVGPVAQSSIVDVKKEAISITSSTSDEAQKQAAASSLGQPIVKVAKLKPKMLKKLKTKVKQTSKVKAEVSVDPKLEVNTQHEKKSVMKGPLDDDSDCQEYFSPTVVTQVSGLLRSPSLSTSPKM